MSQKIKNKMFDDAWNDRMTIKFTIGERITNDHGDIGIITLIHHTMAWCVGADNDEVAYDITWETKFVRRSLTDFLLNRPRKMVTTLEWQSDLRKYGTLHPTL